MPKYRNWFSLPESSGWARFSEHSSSLKFSDYSRFPQNHNSSSISHGEDKLSGLSGESDVIIFSTESSESSESTKIALKKFIENL